MKNRWITVLFLWLAGSITLAHSIVPHHHHDDITFSNSVIDDDHDSDLGRVVRKKSCLSPSEIAFKPNETDVFTILRGPSVSFKVTFVGFLMIAGKPTYFKSLNIF